MDDQPTRPIRTYYARAMDRCDEASIRRDDAAVRDALAAIGFEIANPYRGNQAERPDSMLLVEENRTILATSSVLIANLSIPHYPYVGIWFEIADARALQIPVASWVGSSGYERHHYLNAYCEFIVEDIHGVTEYLRRVHTTSGIASQLEEAKAYYDAIATRYDEMSSQCYPRERGSQYHLERAALAETLVERCRDKSVLELGCGNGDWTASIVRSARRVQCVDASHTMIAEARARVGSFPLAPEFLACDFFDAQLRFGGFEVVVGFFLLGFLPRPAQMDLLRRIVHECDPGTFVILGESVRQAEIPARGIGSVRLQSRDVNGIPFVICKEVFSARALTARVRAAGLQIIDERQPASWFSCCVARVPG